MKFNLILIIKEILKIRYFSGKEIINAHQKILNVRKPQARGLPETNGFPSSKDFPFQVKGFLLDLEVQDEKTVGKSVLGAPAF